jgi:hypothetical protein
VGGLDVAPGDLQEQGQTRGIVAMIVHDEDARSAGSFHASGLQSVGESS